MKTREQKQQERAAKLAQQECDRVAYYAKQLATKRAPVDETPAERMEAERLLLTGATSRRHVGAGW